MSELNISLDSGTSKRLLTAGKYCDRDIVVTAEGGGGIVPSGEIKITDNGTYDVTERATAVVDVVRSGNLEYVTGTFTTERGETLEEGIEISGLGFWPSLVCVHAGDFAEEYATLSGISHYNRYYLVQASAGYNWNTSAGERCVSYTIINSNKYGAEIMFSTNPYDDAVCVEPYDGGFIIYSTGVSFGSIETYGGVYRYYAYK